MKNKYLFVTVMLFTLMIASAGLTVLYVCQEQPDSSRDFNVVTSFYPMYIAAENVIGGCDGVTLVNLSEPQTGCMHDYQLTPEDMKKLSRADAFIVNGGGIENFLADVAKQYPDLQVINASEKAALLENNAHAWMSIPDHMTQVQTIAEGLCALDEKHGQIYQKNSTDYLSKLEELYRQQQNMAKESEPQNVVIFHEAFEYTARDFQFQIAGIMDLDEERQVSAGETAQVLEQIRENEVRIILAEELYGKPMCETIQKETKVQAVYLDTCVRGSYDADSYLNAMQGNLLKLKEGIKNAQNYQALRPPLYKDQPSGCCDWFSGDFIGHQSSYTLRLAECCCGKKRRRKIHAGESGTGGSAIYGQHSI